MKINQQWYLDFIGQDRTQFTIPRYQRAYSWLKIQCEELWEDVMRVGRDQVSHFISTTLYLDAGVTPDGTRRLDIIDGQQRIASTTILLTALRDYLRETGTVLEGCVLANQPGVEPRDFDADALHNSFLVTRDGDAEVLRVQLIGPDRTTLAALVMGEPLPEHVSSRVRDNYAYFSGRMHEEGFDPQILWRGLRELLVVASELGENDKAQTIFESLNTKGLPLTGADLIRNYLLVSESHAEQQRLYKEYWQPMELMFRDDSLSSGSLKLNTGLRMWLTIRCKRMVISDRSRTYHYFKIYMNTQFDGTSEDLLDELRSFCYLWAQNYSLNPGRAHCSKFEWAKRSQGKTLIPPMARSADIMRMTRSKSREQIMLEQMEKQKERLQGTKACPVPTFRTTEAGHEATTFGRWGGEPIEWRVLERDDESALIIAEKVLDTFPYHSTYSGTTWHDCYLRSWANSTFVEEAFTSAESKRLMDNQVHTADDELWDTVGGEDCQDKVFLLSFEEALNLFGSAQERIAAPTDYAVKAGVYVENGYCLWWLRSPGHGQGFASTVWPVGGVDTAGSGVGRPGVGFRPVIRLKLKD
ncbi:MAG: DUF262 domain-containing protein [Coriobacteriia bacterium]|nr:DUF262 domain-containing protein [Coriobacteriia bacterium]